MSAHLARKRALVGRTGCGVCGIEDLGHLPKARRRLAPARAVAPAAVGAAVSALDALQPLNQRTRAVHAAAWCERDGAISVVREDVGRHNALDKLIGALLRERADPDDGFFVITSRCSFEMVAKAATFGAGDAGLGVGADLARAAARARSAALRCHRGRARRSGAVLRARWARRARRGGGVSAAKIDKLVQMANQIGDFFAPMPESEATQGVATHLRRYLDAEDDC